MPIIANNKMRVGDLLGSRSPFKIPKHQRAFSWGEDEIETFCKDIISLSAQDSPTEYFFGGIVSVQEPADNLQGRVYSVVDGQQRLTTFTLLLAQIRDAYMTLADLANHEGNASVAEAARTRSDNINAQYVVHLNTRINLPRKQTRLVLSSLDERFFENLVAGCRNQNQTNPYKAVSHKRLNDAWDDINALVIAPILDTHGDVEEKLEELVRLENYFLDYCVVIHIVCDTKTEAYQLFEVLNDRGRDLATGDYLRSYTLELLDAHPLYLDDASSLWDELLADGLASDFFKAYYAAHTGSSQRSRQLHTMIRESLFNYGTNPISATEANAIKDRIANMVSMFETYQQLRKGDWPYASSATRAWDKNRLSMLINMLDHTLCIPLLLAIYECADEAAFRDAVLLIEKAAFRYITISSKRANKLAEIYAKQIKTLRSHPHTFGISSLRKSLDDLVSAQASDVIFREQLTNELVYKRSKKAKNKIRYFMTTMEYYLPSYLRNDDPLVPMTTHTFNWDTLQIEHIYPQNATVRDPLLEPLKDNIGNLVFWGENDNKAASNALFNNKRPAYEASSIVLTRRLGRYTAWSLESYNDMLSFYQDIACRVFSF